MEQNSYILLQGLTGLTGSQGIITLQDGIPATLSMGVGEVQDITNKTNTFSNKIKIPGNNNNNKLFGHAFDINATDLTYDINHKQRCIVIDDGIPILEGYIQLISVDTVADAVSTNDELITYVALIFDNKTTLYDAIDQSFLEDLDYSQYNHALTSTNIFASSGNTWEDAYKYRLPWKNSLWYFPTDFQAQIFAKHYYMKIHEEQGFSVEGFPVTSEDFAKIVVPYNGGPAEIDNDERLRRGFQASIVGGVDYVQRRNDGAAGFSLDEFSSNSIGGASVQPFAIRVPYNDDSTGANFDSGDTFSTSLNRWTADVNGSFDLSAAFKGTLVYSASTNGFRFPNLLPLYPTAPWITQNFGTEFKVSFIKNIDSLPPINFSNIQLFLDAIIATSSGVKVGNPSRSQFDSDGPDIVADTIYEYDFDLSLVMQNITLNDGDTIDAYISFNQPFNNYYDTGNPAFWVGGPPNDSRFIPVTVKLEFDGTTVGASNRIKNDAYIGGVAESDTVILNNYIPKKIKQKDFLGSMNKLFNLFIEQDKDNENNLIVYTRDDYYSGTTYVDWTEKLEKKITRNTRFISEIQNKQLSFSYKIDKDSYNQSYFLNTNLIYGQKLFNFDNDHLIGVKKIEPIFSPTPLVIGKSFFPISFIESNPKNNIRLLYDGGNQPGTWNFSSFTNGVEVRQTYMYAGHYDSPSLPTVDINYSQNDYLFINPDSITSNTLYEKYWRKYVDQLTNGKMLTAYFNLTAEDIANLDLRKKVFVLDAYYHINKIVDYDFINKKPTKVELIKIEEGLKNFPEVISDKPSVPQGEQVEEDYFQPGGGSGSGSGEGGVNPYVDDGGGGQNKVSSDRGAVVIGSGNTVTSSSERTMISGNDNYVDSKSATIIGSNNVQVKLGAQNVVIIGTNNVTVTSDDTMFIGGVKFVNGQAVAGWNDIDSGLDTVLNPFYSSSINDIDSGSDAVRSIGGNSSTQDIDSRTDNTNENPSPQ